MSYGVELGPEVKRLLRESPVELAERLLDHIDLLAQQPTKLSHASAGGGSFLPAQVYNFTMTTTAGQYSAVLRFKYSQDEQSLHIESIEIQKE